MYASVVLLSLSLILLLVVLHFALRGRQTTPRPAPPVNQLSLWLYLAVLLSTLVGAVTSWLPIVVRDQPMRGWLLMLHSTMGGLFLVALASLVFLWAGHCRITAESDAQGRQFTWGQKLAFWLAALLGLMVILSSMLPMTPLFGTHGQELLVAIHRYAGLGLVLTLIFHRYLLWLASRRSRTMKGTVHHEASPV